MQQRKVSIILLTSFSTNNAKNFVTLTLKFHGQKLFSWVFLKERITARILLILPNWLLSHVQSEGERGFNINENVVMDYMNVDTILVKRKNIDHLKKNGFQLDDIPISKELLQKIPDEHNLLVKYLWRAKGSRRTRKKLRS